MTNDELIESVAITLHDAHQPNYGGRFYDEEYSDEKDRDFYRRLARAAILAVLDGIREPSEEMIAAGEGAFHAIPVWRAMVEARIRRSRDEEGQIA